MTDHYTLNIVAKKVVKVMSGPERGQVHAKTEYREVEDVFSFVVRADSLNAAIDKATKHMEAEYELDDREKKLNKDPLNYPTATHLQRPSATP